MSLARLSKNLESTRRGEQINFHIPVLEETQIEEWALPPKRRRESIIHQNYYKAKLLPKDWCSIVYMFKKIDYSSDEDYRLF